MSDSQIKEAKKKLFRKLHIVNIRDSAQKTKGKSASLEPIDQLTFTEQTTKLVDYDSKRGIVFMLNKDK